MWSVECNLGSSDKIGHVFQNERYTAYVRGTCHAIKHVAQADGRTAWTITMGQLFLAGVESAIVRERRLTVVRRLREM